MKRKIRIDFHGRFTKLHPVRYRFGLGEALRDFDGQTVGISDVKLCKDGKYFNCHVRLYPGNDISYEAYIPTKDGNAVRRHVLFFRDIAGLTVGEGEPVSSKYFRVRG